MMDSLRRRLTVPTRTLMIYAMLYLSAGLIMNSIGKIAQIAEFRHWWQVATCYVLYLVPASLVIRHREASDQYLFGLLVLGLLELLGYALGTSIAHEGNILDQVLGPRNFTLAMTVFFAGILPAGNLAVAYLDAILPGAAPQLGARLEVEVIRDGLSAAE